MDELIKERLEFLKLEFQQLVGQVQHGENKGWRIRQFSITLWLVSLGVGLGVITEGVRADFIFLIISAAIPIIFLYLDGANRRWTAHHFFRWEQIQKFLSMRNYILPSNGKKISLKKFCSENKITYDFPILDFWGSVTFGNDKDFAIKTGSVLFHMKRGLRVPFYHFQLIASLIVIALQNYKLFHDIRIFFIIAASPLLHLSLVLFSKIREARIQRRAE